MNIARSTVKLLAAKVMSSFVGFLAIAFFSRELSSHQMGVFFLFQTLLGVISIPADFGISNTVTKRLSESDSSSSILSTALLLKGLLLLPFITGIVIFQKSINGYLGADVALLLIPAVILQEFSRFTLCVLRGELRVGKTAGPLLSQKVMYLCIGAVFVLYDSGVHGIIYGLLTGFIVMMIYGIYQSLTTISLPSLRDVHSLFSYSKYAFISKFNGYIYSWMDVAIMGFFLTQSDVGIYEVAWRVSVVVMMFSSPIATTVFPQVSQLDSEDAAGRIESLLTEAITPALIIAIPAFFGVILFSEKILGLIFGSEYMAGSLVLIVLTGEKIIQSVQGIIGRSLQAVNRPDLSAKASVISMFLNFVLNIILIIEYGILGAAVATSVSFILNSLLHFHYLSRFIKVRVPYMKIIACVTASLGMTAVLIVAESVMSIDSLPMLLMIIILGVAVYVGFALIIPSSRHVILRSIERVID